MFALPSVSAVGQLLYSLWIGFFFFFHFPLFSFLLVAARSFLHHVIVSFLYVLWLEALVLALPFFLIFGITCITITSPSLYIFSLSLITYIIVTTQPTSACFQLRLPGSNDLSFLLFYVNVLLLTGKVV